jgi:hypothetical protein
MMPLTHIPGTWSPSSVIALEKDEFLDTCNRVESDTSTGVLTYLDFNYRFSQDHIGMKHMISEDVLTLSAFTKHVQTSPRHVGIMEDEIMNDWSGALSRLRRMDMDFLQDAVYQKYLELGKFHRSETQVSKIKMNSITDIIRAERLSRMNISLQSRTNGDFFMVVGEKAYNILLSYENFFPSKTDFSKKICKVGQLESSCQVFLNMNDPESFLIGKSFNKSGGGGVFLWENPKTMFLEGDITTYRKKLKLRSYEYVGEYGNTPWFNYFTPEIEW